MDGEPRTFYCLDSAFVKVSGTSLTCAAMVSSTTKVILDHFPGHSVIPAYIQLNWVVQLLKESASIERCRFTNVKFLNQLHMGQTIVIEIDTGGPSPKSSGAIQGDQKGSFTISLRDALYDSARQDTVSKGSISF